MTSNFTMGVGTQMKILGGGIVSKARADALVLPLLLATTSAILEIQRHQASTATQDVSDPGNGLHLDATSTSLRMLNELEGVGYFGSSGAGSGPYTTLFPEGEVSGFASDCMGSISETDTGVENRGFEYFQQPLNWSASMVSQELPALSAPQPSPSPSHTEPDEPICVDGNDYIAPRDINLNLDERNMQIHSQQCGQRSGDSTNTA
ncbi:hypothetical protein B0H13DRAFT_2311711 [Mycena leptocephala]|nr:hypothetical protein B0H13DRAFT_2311711 [Mycena leptocephala]